jgi:hypothetical protein
VAELVDALGLGSSGVTREGSSPFIDICFSKIKMKINLWYSENQKQWRWTLCDDSDKMLQESGQRPFLRDAMNDVANTVEYMLQCQQSE